MLPKQPTLKKYHPQFGLSICLATFFSDATFLGTMEPSQMDLVTTPQASPTDADILNRVQAVILRQAEGIGKFSSAVPLLFRRALDEVIDSARTNRLTLDELEKTEKTYIGTKIEILFRAFLKLPKGQILDLLADDIEVDIKNTIGSNWTIPEEAYNHPCVLLKCNEKTALCSVGLIVVREEFLNPGRNKDKKATFSDLGRQNIQWILHDVPYPKNFWESLGPDGTKYIMTPEGGTERMARLFRRVQRMPIPRNVIDAVAQQDDPTRRIRKNGGARDKLAKERIVILSGENDSKIIAALSLPHCTEDEFISIMPSNDAETALLRANGHDV